MCGEWRMYDLHERAGGGGGAEDQLKVLWT